MSVDERGAGAQRLARSAPAQRPTSPHDHTHHYIVRNVRDHYFVSTKINVFYQGLRKKLFAAARQARLRRCAPW